MRVGFCSECEYKTTLRRRHGVAYKCNKSCTNMSVTYFTREKHIDEQNKLCPLLNKGSN